MSRLYNVISYHFIFRKRVSCNLLSLRPKALQNLLLETFSDELIRYCFSKQMFPVSTVGPKIWEYLHWIILILLLVLLWTNSFVENEFPVRSRSNEFQEINIWHVMLTDFCVPFFHFHKFRPFLPFWLNLAENGWKWLNLAEFWLKMVENGWIFPPPWRLRSLHQTFEA